VAIINNKGNPYTYHAESFSVLLRFATESLCTLCFVNLGKVRFPFCALRNPSGAITLPLDRSRRKSTVSRSHCCLTVGNDGFALEAA